MKTLACLSMVSCFLFFSACGAFDDGGANRTQPVVTQEQDAAPTIPSLELFTDIMAAPAIASLDPFTNISAVEADFQNPITAATQDDPEIAGGERDIVVETFDEYHRVSLYTSSENLLALATSVSAGMAQIVWDGDDNDATTIDYQGLGGINLGDGHLDLTIHSLDLAWFESVQFEIDVYTDADNWSRYTGTNEIFGITAEGISIRSPITVTIAPTEFIVQQGEGADFTNVGAASLTITTLSSSVDLCMLPLEWFQTQ